MRKKMITKMGVVSIILVCSFSACSQSRLEYSACLKNSLEYKDLFNGKDLSGWIDVNTSDETWSMRDGILVCSGHPIGVMRSERQYENFILQIEWKHMEAGGNSGVFVWSRALIPEGKRLPDGVEVQMLELAYAPMHKVTEDYVHGELFGVGGVKTVPDNPRGSRSKSIEKRCKGKGEWNKYIVVCVDGVIKLSVNGKFVNGVRQSTAKKGYLCLESEGGEIHFRNMRIMELPPSFSKDDSPSAPTNLKVEE